MDGIDVSLVFPLNGFDWIWLGFGILEDVAGYVGGYQSGKQVPLYTGP